MIILNGKKREKFGKKVKELRKEGVIPAVLYGPKMNYSALKGGVSLRASSFGSKAAEKKSQPIEVNQKEFKKIFKESGESTLISLLIGKEKFPVLIHEIKEDPITNEPIHIDFYQPILTEEVEVSVPLVFEGVSLAVKDLGGTLLKEIQEIKIKALPENLPHDIKVNIEPLKTFEDKILVKDLVLPNGVKILKEPDEFVALAVPPQKVAEELAKPIEEKVEEIEKVETKKEKEEEFKEESPAKETKEKKEEKK